MKNIILLLILIILSLKSNSQSDCKKFRNGIFFYPGMKDKITIRKDSIQESYSNGKLEMVWKVRWLTDCEYEIICDKILTFNSSFQKGDKILVRIISTNETCYDSSLIFYSKENPQGERIPGGLLCVKY